MGGNGETGNRGVGGWARPAPFTPVSPFLRFAHSPTPPCNHLKSARVKHFGASRTHKACLSDSELIQRVLAGDVSAERALYDTHVDRVYRLAFRLAGHDADLA